MKPFRDWPRTLAPASYGGVAFFVETDSIDTGRRLAVHEFPLADEPYVEDLGRKANEIKVTAYLVGDTADADQVKLRQVCEQGGAKTLVLPMDRLPAHCRDCRRAFHKDKLGYVAFDLDFIRDGSGAAPFSLALLGRLVEFAAGALAGTVDLPGPLRQAFTGTFQGLGVAGFVTDAATGIVQDFAGALDALRQQVPLDAALAPGVSLAIADLYADAGELVAVGALGDRFSARSFAASGVTAIAAPIVDRVFGLVGAFAAALPERDAVSSLGQMLTFGDDFAAVPLTTPSRRIEAQNQAALVTLVRASVLANWSTALVQTEYADRRSAIQARADAAEAFEGELERLSGAATQPLWTALYDLQGKVTTALSGQVASLAPVLSVSSAITLPALWWANRLYGDAARAEEIAARNRVKHPLFMPREMEVLAR